MDYSLAHFAHAIAHGFVERADRKRRHLGFDFERWVDQSGVPFLSSVSCSSRLFLYLYLQDGSLVRRRERESLYGKGE